MGIKVRHKIESTELDLAFVLLPFKDDITVDPRCCPQGILVRNHWLTGTQCMCAADPTQEGM